MEIILVLSVLFISTLVRSTFGFGDALIAMPLLAVFLSITTVTPLVALVAFSIALYIVISDYKKIVFTQIWRLVISSIIGIPIGLFYLKDVDEETIKIILGILIILFALYNLFKPEVIRLKHNFWSYIFGFLAGIIGAAYNTNGPFIVIYGTTQKWNPGKFRATLQGYFFTTGIFVLAGHLLAGNMTGKVLKLYLFSIPVFMVAIVLGSFLNKKISEEKFLKYIFLFLILTGCFLIYKNIM